MATQRDMFETVEDQAREASITGGVTQVAQDPTQDRVQVAGLKEILTNIIPVKKFIKDYAETVNTDVRATPEGAEDTVAGSVPTMRQEELLSGKSYEDTQKFFAKKLVDKGLLSQEKYDEFEKAGFVNLDKSQEVLNLNQTEVEKLREEALDAVKTEQDPSKPVKVSEQTEKQAMEFADTVDAVKVGDGGIDINFDRIIAGEDILKVYNKVSELKRKEIDQGKRGVVTFEEEIANAEKELADEMGLKVKMLRKKKGRLASHEILALRELTVKSAKNLLDAAKAVNAFRENNPKINLSQDREGQQLILKLNRALAIHGGLQERQISEVTEAARALNAMKIPVGREKDKMFMAEAIENAVEASGGNKYTLKLAEKIVNSHETGGNGALSKIANAANAGKKYFTEIYINGLLSGPKTILKNAIGVPAFALYELPRDIVAAGISGLERSIRRAVGKDSTEYGASLGEINSRLFGMSMAFKNALLLGKKGWDTEKGIGPTRIDGDAHKNISSSLDNPIGEMINNAGKFIRLPGRTLLATDEFGKAIAENGELYAQAFTAYKNAKFIGKSEEDAQADAFLVLLDPKSRRTETEKAANHITLTSDVGAIGKATTYLQQSLAGRLLIPFARVPTNAIFRTLENNAVTGLLSPSMRKAIFQGGPRERAKALGSMAYGSMVMYTFSEYAMSGRLTGGYPKEGKERRKLPPGWQPYSFVLRGEGFPKDDEGEYLPLYDEKGLPNGPLTYVSYAGIEPLGAILGISAEYVESGRRTSDPQAQDKKASRAVLAAANYFMELPMLQGIQSVIKMIEYEDITFLTDSPLGNLIPYVGALRTANKIIDPTSARYSEQINLYTSKDPEAVADTDLIGTPKGNNFFYDMIKRGTDLSYNNAINISGQDVEEQEDFAPIYDVFGKKKTKNVLFSENPVLAVYNAIVPFEISKGEKMTLLQKEVVNLGMPLVETKKTVTAARVPVSKKFAADWTNTSKNIIKIQPRQLKNAGMRNNKFYTFKEALETLITLPSYKMSGRFPNTDEKKAGMIKKIENEYYAAGLEYMLADVENREAQDLKLVIKNLKSAGRIN